MIDLIEKLIAELRNELNEYGEMLALLEEQQEHLLAHRADGVLASVERINHQAVVLRRSREARTDTQRLLAHSLGNGSADNVRTLATTLPGAHGQLVLTLVNENSQLLTQVQQCGRQNFLMLSRAVDLMQQFLGTLSPGQNLFAYSETGAPANRSPKTLLYEAIG